jgi:hypothetical protein
VPGIMTLGFFVPVVEKPKTSRFESKDRSSYQRATDYFRS